MYIPDEDEDSGEATGGQTGEIHFRYRDVMSLEPRDDALPPEMIRHGQLTHKDNHLALVIKQRETQKARAAAKLGQKYYPPNAQLGYGGGGENNFKPFPALANEAQFAGREKQSNPLPNLAEPVNEGQKNELQNRMENKYRHVPKFNPRPQMPR